jgi:PhzF family phenazine biosynthesis protein
MRLEQSNRLPIYQVDAFTDRVFAGNPAAVIPLEAWLPDAMLQAIAAENNLPATAFFRYEGESCAIRWFTPTVELPLCGHGTLAAAHVILNLLDTRASRIVFDTKAGALTVSRHGSGLALDLPLNRAAPCALPPGLAEALGKLPVAVLTTRNYLAVFDCASDVAGMTPDFAALAQLHCIGVIITAPGRDGVHCVSRYFAPALGVDEDAVTGSAHCTIVPYWSGRLGKSTIVGRQISRRGGALTGEVCGDRVILAGEARLYLEGTITV